MQKPSAKRPRPMGLDISGLATERLTRSEAIDLMVDEARAASKRRQLALEDERAALRRFSAEDVGLLLGSAARPVVDGPHGDVIGTIAFRSYHDRTRGSVELRFDLTDLPDFADRVARLLAIEEELREEADVQRTLADRTAVRGFLLRGLLADTADGRLLLSQLGQAAERFREAIRARGGRTLR